MRTHFPLPAPVATAANPGGALVAPAAPPAPTVRESPSGPAWSGQRRQ